MVMLSGRCGMPSSGMVDQVLTLSPLRMTRRSYCRQDKRHSGLESGIGGQDSIIPAAAAEFAPLKCYSHEQHASLVCGQVEASTIDVRAVVAATV